MGGKSEITLEKAEDAEFQYYAQDGFHVNTEGRPDSNRPAASGDVRFTRTFKLYTNPEDRTEEGHPRLEVEDTDVQVHDGSQFHESQDKTREVKLEVDLDDIEENPPEATDADVDLSPQDFDSEAERRKYIELERAVRDWHQSNPAPRGV